MRSEYLVCENVEVNNQEMDASINNQLMDVDILPEEYDYGTFTF